MVGIVISFVTLSLAALGWFAKKWVVKVEEDIKLRVTKDICESEHTKQEELGSKEEKIRKERRETDREKMEEFILGVKEQRAINKKLIDDLSTDLRQLEKRFNDHMDAVRDMLMKDCQ
jgi:hypothetical protein